MEAKARNQNSDCAMCCNPTPTEVYKHLPGFVKLLCSIDTKVSAATGTGTFVKAISPTFVTPVLGAATASSVTINKTNATQTTSPATAVTVNGTAGIITTVSQSLAVGASLSFTVNNLAVKSNSVILFNLDDSAITTGTAMVRLGTVLNGSFVVKVINTNTLAALNNILKIHYLVV